MSERMFPVLLGPREKRIVPDCLKEIPWSAIAPYEDQVTKNHCGQTLEALARRGGLSPLEISYVCCRARYQPVPNEKYPGALMEAAMFLQHLASMDTEGEAG